MERYELGQNYDVILKAPFCAKRSLINRLWLTEAFWNRYGVVLNRSSHTY